jgi:hypothetical protein
VPMPAIFHVCGPGAGSDTCLLWSRSNKLWSMVDLFVLIHDVLSRYCAENLLVNKSHTVVTFSVCALVI